MRRSSGDPVTRRLLDYGSGAVLLECADLTEALSLLSVVRGAVDPVTEVVPGARTLLLRLSGPLSPTDRQTLLTVVGQPVRPTGGEAITLRVRYDGADLDEVARLTGLSVEGVVRAHTSQTWTVAFCGFAPGFAYLRGEHDALAVPRRSTPRTAVPTGSVGLAGPWSGVYPRRGPGGWQLIGRTDTTLWDLDAEPPALLQPGHKLHFVES